MRTGEQNTTLLQQANRAESYESLTPFPPNSKIVELRIFIVFPVEDTLVIFSIFKVKVSVSSHIRVKWSSTYSN